MKRSPLAASSSGQSACERITSGTKAAPSPTASRVMRVRPWLEPWSCGGAKRSMPTTRAPPAAR